MWGSSRRGGRRRGGSQRGYAHQLSVIGQKLATIIGKRLVLDDMFASPPLLVCSRRLSRRPFCAIVTAGANGGRGGAIGASGGGGVV